MHRLYFDPNQVQISTLLSIKTGACPEDCSYCSQSIRFETGLKSEPLMDLDEVMEKARAAKANGATRFCMGAAYRSPKPKQLAQIVDMIKGVRAMGMETCVTLGMLTPEQAHQLKDAGLDYYNHNLDTSESHYKKVITTRTYQDRLDTLEAVRNAEVSMCVVAAFSAWARRNRIARSCYTRSRRCLNIRTACRSISSCRCKARRCMARKSRTRWISCACIAVARLLMPKAHVRLSAGRSGMSDETQALAFLAGANSIFYGDKLLTTENPKKIRTANCSRSSASRAEPLAQPGAGQDAQELPGAQGCAVTGLAAFRGRAARH